MLDTQNWSIRQLIIVSFAVILVLMVVMAGISLRGLRAVVPDLERIETDSLPGLYQSGQLMAGWENNDVLTEEHVLTSDPATMRALEARLRANDSTVADFTRQYAAALFSDPDRESYAAVAAASAAYERTQRAVLKLSSDPRTKTAARRLILQRMDPAFTKLRSALTAILDFNKTNVTSSTGQIDAAVASTTTGIFGSLAAALVVAFVCGSFLLRGISVILGQVAGVAKEIGSGNLTVETSSRGRKGEIGILTLAFDQMITSLSSLVGQVQKSGNQVNLSITEIAATAKEQQAMASETAATVSEIGATSREITATSRELVKTMGEVSAVAEHTATLAGTGQQSVTRMEETMHNVVEAAGSVNAKLTILGERAANINQVITTITKVADQTNLLSLNAAIEAEKAGEYGRGFAVVATEIRRLADQTAIATFDIEQMVKDIHSAVSAAVMGMDKFSEQVRRGIEDIHVAADGLTQIIMQTQALAPRVESINEGVQAQATGAEQITDALAQLSEAAQQTVESLRQSSAAIGELNHVSVGLRNGVSGFILPA